MTRKRTETCDMIYGLGDNRVGLCGKPAVARTKHKTSPITASGRVRYCADCLKTISLWGVPTEPLGGVGAEPPPSEK